MDLVFASETRREPIHAGTEPPWMGLRRVAEVHTGAWHGNESPAFYMGL